MLPNPAIIRNTAPHHKGVYDKGNRYHVAFSPVMILFLSLSCKGGGRAGLSCPHQPPPGPAERDLRQRMHIFLAPPVREGCGEGFSAPTQPPPHRGGFLFCPMPYLFL